MLRLYAQRGSRLAVASIACLFLGAFVSTSSASEPSGTLAWATDQHFQNELASPSVVSATDFGHEALIDFWADPAQFQQPLAPQVESGQSVALPAAAARANAELFGAFGVARSPVSLAGASSFDSVSGAESVIRATTDVGDLLGSGAGVLNLGVQRRNPIVNDPRVRGSRVGSLAASGSYWVPARIDLDTAVSKIDSRIVDQVTVVPGPYSALYGPGLQFIDIDLQQAPRFQQGFETHGSTNVEYRTNGEQWYGRQSAWGGDDVWGFRMGYGHRTGSDYSSGDGQLVPSSYKSREVDIALGGQLTPNGVIDAQLLRLDQTDVELAGQAFDIDVLVTDGYEVTYAVDNPAWADRVSLETWYNQTELLGSAQRPSKRSQFPFFDALDFIGRTDVDSLSTGYRLSSIWEVGADERIEAGADLRYVRQELNEITSGRRGFFIFTDANSPVPDSYWVNPGLFAEASTGVTEDVHLAVGGRLDYVGTDVFDGKTDLTAVGTNSLPAGEILGSDDFEQNDTLGLGYLSLSGESESGWGAGAKVGYAERAPNLTERYAIEPFMFLIQNGLNTVTGDPELDKERLIQVDLRVSHQAEEFRGEVVAFHNWIRDYATFEALSVVQDEQVNLKYVNTDLATFWGWEARAEYDWNVLLTPFATLKYVEGTDRTRNGNFATKQAVPGSPSIQDPNLPRGSFSGSGVTLTDSEPLPGILPLESRLGLRWEEKQAAIPWGLEVSSRIVDRQDRVAASLLESSTPGFTIWDLRTFIRPTERLSIVSGVENFTDKQFREHLDFRSRNPDAISTFRPGVSFYFATELSY